MSMLNKKNCWGFYDSGFNEGSYNMAVDEMLLNHAVAKQQKYPTLRIYGFYRKTVTIGYGQKIKDLAGLDDYKKQGYEICRRITGGGAVFHGEDLTYSLIVPLQAFPDFAPAMRSYRLIHSAIARGLKNYGLKVSFSVCENNAAGPLCFETPVRDDLLIGKRKIAGGAQKRVADFMLHQGSIDFASIKKSEQNFFNLFEEVKNFVIDGFKKTFDTDFVLLDFSLKELQEASKLAKEKYQAFSWNFRC
ncbi:MAG: lipoate--protein ligase family protein [Candidatus Omnitrophica bacterium]|nr:lipoate--protein ligase family protein [Candidatus Omnitrophota bacterium]